MGCFLPTESPPFIGCTTPTQAQPKPSNPYRPFEDNAIFRNLCFDSSQFDSTGHPFTGIGYTDMPTLVNWAFNFNSLTYTQAGSTNVPSLLLGLTNGQYIFNRKA